MQNINAWGEDKYWCFFCNMPVSKRDRQHETTRRHMAAAGTSGLVTMPTCGYCFKDFSRPYGVGRHLKTCQRNPENINPITTVALATTNDDTDISSDEGWQLMDETIRLWELDSSAEFDHYSEGSSAFAGAVPGTGIEDACHYSSHLVEVPSTTVGSDEKRTNVGCEDQRSSSSPEISPRNDSEVDMASPMPIFQPTLHPPRDHETPLPVVGTSDRDAATSRLPDRTRELLDRPGQKPPPVKRQVLCHICLKHIDNDVTNILAHLKSHQGRFVEHVCNKCEVGFQHAEDLSFHHKCATGSNPHCGFKFKHTSTCIGHHPPEANQPPESFPDHDRFKLGYFVRNWEGAELHALMISMDSLLYGANSDPYRWSSREADECRRSFASFATTIASFRSAPVHVNFAAKDTLAAMESRLRRLRPGALRDQVLEARKRTESLQQAKRDAPKFAQAIEDDDFVTVGEMLASGFALDTILTGYKYESPKVSLRPFALAALLGRVRMLCYILDHETSMTVLGQVPSNSPLENVLLAKKFKCADILLSLGVSVNQVMREHAHEDNPEHTLINYFARFGCAASVRVLVSHGACITEQELIIAWRRATSVGDPMFQMTLERSDDQDRLELLRCLLGAQKWKNPNILPSFLEFALPEAVAGQREDLARLLIYHGANVHQTKGFQNDSALEEATQLGDLDMVSLLLSKGFNAISDAGYLSLCIAAKSGNSQMMALLVQYNAPVNVISRLGHSPIYYAVQFGNEDNVRILLAAVPGRTGSTSDESDVGEKRMNPIDAASKAEGYAQREWEAVVLPPAMGCIPDMQLMVDMLEKIFQE